MANETSSGNSSWVKPAIHVAVAIILGIIIGTATPPVGLKIEAVRFIGIFMAVIYLLVVDALPDYVVAFLGVMAVVVFKVTEYKVAVGGLVGTTNMLIASAIIIGTAATRSGVINRITLWIMQFFPATYRGQLASILTVGTAIAPLIPGAAAKGALAGPFSATVSNILGFANKSKGAAGIFAATFVCFCSFPIMFLSGSAWGIVLFGLSKQVQAEFTWTKWFISAMPWGIVIILGTYFAVQLLYKAEETKNIVEGFAKSGLEKIGPMSRKEKLASFVLAAVLILWILEKVIGVSSVVIAAVGAASYVLIGVFDRKEFRALIPWDSVIFLGSILCFADIFSAVGIPAFLAKSLGGTFKPFVSNVYLYTAILSILVGAVRTVIISQVACMTIFFLTVSPLAEVAGIHPWITGFTIISATVTWNSYISNSGWLTAYTTANSGELVTYSSQLKMSIAYMVLSIIGLWISVPFWKMAGLL